MPKSVLSKPAFESGANRLRRTLLCALLAALPLAQAAAEDAAPAKPRSMQEILDASRPSDWRTPENKNLLYLELESGRVLIELAPGFAPAHVANIRTKHSSRPSSTSPS